MPNLWKKIRSVLILFDVYKFKFIFVTLFEKKWAPKRKLVTDTLT